jgi:hypothetical protein
MGHCALGPTSTWVETRNAAAAILPCFRDSLYGVNSNTACLMGGYNVRERKLFGCRVAMQSRQQPSHTFHRIE